MNQLYCYHRLHFLLFLEIHHHQINKNQGKCYPNFQVLLSNHHIYLINRLIFLLPLLEKNYLNSIFYCFFYFFGHIQDLCIAKYKNIDSSINIHGYYRLGITLAGILIFSIGRIELILQIKTAKIIFSFFNFLISILQIKR